MWSAEDEAVIATNIDASECKRSAVELGYWKDDYIKYFVKHCDRKAPEIHRGYYARVRAMEMFIHQFLERSGTKCQIINLGCGYDTLYWRLKEQNQSVENFIELDFPTVTAKKIQIIKRNKALLEKISTEDGEVALRGSDLRADGYALAGCDLRCAAAVRRALAAAGLAERPTLALAECVLVYLRRAAADELLRLLAELCPRLVLLTYEQCALGDAFGEVMLRNLSRRGCALGAGALESPAARAARLQALGFRRARAWDMAAVWRALPEDERARAEAREMLDERELLTQLNAHYALCVASNSDMFADLDLNA